MPQLMPMLLVTGGTVVAKLQFKTSSKCYTLKLGEKKQRDLPLQCRCGWRNAETMDRLAAAAAATAILFNG